ncbi:unnamed protein product [Arctogadus glacialis]
MDGGRFSTMEGLQVCGEENIPGPWDYGTGRGQLHTRCLYLPVCCARTQRGCCMGCDQCQGGIMKWRCLGKRRCSRETLGKASDLARWMAGCWRLSKGSLRGMADETSSEEEAEAVRIGAPSLLSGLGQSGTEGSLVESHEPPVVLLLHRCATGVPLVCQEWNTTSDEINRQLNRMRFILSRRLMAPFHGKRCGSEDALSVPLAESSALTAASCTQLPAVHCSYSRSPPHQPPTGPGFLRFGGRLSAAVDMKIKLAAFSS